MRLIIGQGGAMHVLLSCLVLCRIFMSVTINTLLLLRLLLLLLWPVVTNNTQDEKSLWCNKEVLLKDVKWVARKGDYYKYQLPLSMFQCTENSSAKSITNINRVDIANTNERDADYCIDEMVLIPKGSGNDGKKQQQSAKPGDQYGFNSGAFQP
jgi:hypothetical protein